MAIMVVTAKNCGQCGGHGWISVPRSSSARTWEYEQAECECVAWPELFSDWHIYRQLSELERERFIAEPF